MYLPVSRIKVDQIYRKEQIKGLSQQIDVKIKCNTIHVYNKTDTAITKLELYYLIEKNCNTSP